jgi:hypothetical protein
VHIVVVKQTDETLAEPAAGMVRRFLFEFFEGATVKDTKAWRRFWRAMNEAGSGEYFSFKLERQRQNWRHKKHMGLISKVFDSQERFTDFEQFRLWLKVGSGFVDWRRLPGAEVDQFRPVQRGRIHRVPRQRGGLSAHRTRGQIPVPGCAHIPGRNRHRKNLIPLRKAAR